MCMQFTLDKNPSKIFLFTTSLVLLVTTGPGARQSATDSAQVVDQIRTLYESKPLAFKPLYSSCYSAMHIYIPPRSSLC